jgi:imidazole glycerol-phosphate synthase subunit HisH
MSEQTSPTIVVIDYGAGNLRSVVRALAKIGARLEVTSDPEVVRSAPVVVLPGVGATLDTVQSLRRMGMDTAIVEAIDAGKPFLGICVGMQVLCERSEEFGPHECLGVVGGSVRRLPERGDAAGEAGQKVPQIGWNQVRYASHLADHPLFAGIPDGSDFYFVHSFYCDLSEPSMAAGTTDYGVTFPSTLLRGNLAAVQFHPEKSGRWGLQLLSNFVNWASSQEPGVRSQKLLAPGSRLLAPGS